MKTRQLDAAAFQATFVLPMRDVAITATNVINIWPYVAAIPADELFGHAIGAGCVEHVYRNGNSTFDHVLVVTGKSNVFLAVVVDLAQNAILGHHVLDLNLEYGLLPSSD